MADTSAFIGNLILRGKIECLTGLHIGGSKEKLEIGGVDSPVIRDPGTRYPYVPGSSLKGKLRSLLEYGIGAVEPDGEVSKAVEIARLFGIGADEKNNDKDNKKFRPDLEFIGPTRLVVRDCHPDAYTKGTWEKLDTELQYTEIKSENFINRLTSAANPRFIERVVAGSRFDFEIVYSVFQIKDSGDAYKKEVQDDLKNLRMALLMLEHNFLGKSGSRGYGRVKFHFGNPIWVAKSDYFSPNGKISASKASLADLEQLQPTDQVNWSVIPGISIN
jgi:CRISPR-associated protein Csm3